jgi:hypothetical protein
MSKLIEYVDEMRARLDEVSGTEKLLIRALDEALRRVDQNLLADVRDVTLAHEARRVAILEELQGLASRIGAFPALPSPQPQTIEANGHALPPGTPPPLPSDQLRAGDWRQAVSNIKEELDGFFGRDVQH